MSFFLLFLTVAKMGKGTTSAIKLKLMKAVYKSLQAILGVVVEWLCLLLKSQKCRCSGPRPEVFGIESSHVVPTGGGAGCL